MKYRLDKYGNKISALGYGCMRFKRNAGMLDKKEAEKQIMEAYQLGVNYYDTAYIYPGSEALIGEIFEKNNIRNKVNIATKLPHYLIKSREGIEKIFNEELKRLRTTWIDFYLMHMLGDVNTWERLKGMGIAEWIDEKKKTGQIRQIGFSYHGNSESFCKLIDAYDWDFCLIQYNYLDEFSQAGRKGLQYAHSKGIPVFIMEPLRGGRLVNKLPAEAKQVFAHHKPSYTPAQWSFRWLYNQPEVTCVLSGMNSIEMIRDNAKTASTASVGDLTASDMNMLKKVVNAINSKMKVGCTGCGYCVPCPKGVDIPGVFAAYNRRYTDNKFWGLVDYVKCTALRKNSTGASNCIKCGKCEKHCPQGIPIRENLQKAEKEFEGPVYKFVYKVARKFMKF